MSVVAHLIGTDQLPAQGQLERPDCCVTLNPETGERAILIKNHHGDWGVVVGKWVGAIKGVPGIKDSRSQYPVPGIRGSPGHLKIRFLKFVKKKWKKAKLPYEKEDYFLWLYPLVADMFAGEISIYPDKTEEVAEYLAVAFSVGLLHVLCQPHFKGWKPGTTSTPPETRGDVRVKQMPSDLMALVIAGGYKVETPSNFHYYKSSQQCNPKKGGCCEACGGHVYTAAIACLGDTDAGDCGGCGACGGCGGCTTCGSCGGGCGD